MALNDMLGALAKYGENHNQDISKIRDLMNDPEPEQVHYGRGQNPNSRKNLELRNGNKGSSGKRYINDGTKMWKIPVGEILPDGCYEGMIKGIKRTKKLKELEDKETQVLKALHDRLTTGNN